MEFEIRRASIQDLSILTSLRTEVLISANGLPEDTVLPEIEQNTAKFLAERFDDQVTLLAYCETDIAAVGSICFYNALPTCDCPDGRRAYIMNMYTRSTYRGCGVATMILNELVEDAHSRKITSIALEATDMGRGVYEKYGFIRAENEMLLPQRDLYGNAK